MNQKQGFLDRLFHLKEHSTDVKTELIARCNNVYGNGLHFGGQSVNS